MILPGLILHSRVNQQWFDSGMDSLQHCKDKKHFQNYPYPVVYNYNSRGFRDTEWPSDAGKLAEAIWCLGDSFTVGNGQPFSHIWPQVLQSKTGRRCINVSMDGASNDWIFRHALNIADMIKPSNIVIMWSYTHRRESPNKLLSDEQRRLLGCGDSLSQNTYHWIDLVNKISDTYGSIVHCTIPQFDYVLSDGMKQHWQAVSAASWPECPCTLVDFENLPSWIQQELRYVHGCYHTMREYFMDLSDHTEFIREAVSQIKTDVIHIEKNLDWARDHHHFDILTSQWVVDQIVSRLHTY